MVLDGKSLRDYSVNAGVPQGPIIGPALSRHTLMTFFMMLSVILITMLMILISTVSLTRHLVFGNN